MLPGLSGIGGLIGGQIADLYGVIPTAGKTLIGDMTGSDGLPAHHDSNTGSVGYAAATSGYSGVDFGAGNGVRVEKVEVSSNVNGFDASGSTTTINIKLFGSNSLPSNGTDGTELGATGDFTDTNAIHSKTITSSDTTTRYRYVWTYCTTGVWTVFSVTEYTGWY